MSKKKPQMIQIRPFKDNERGEGKSQFGGQRKEKENLPMFGGQWKEKEKFLCLVVNGRRRRRRSSFPPLFISPPTNFIQTFIFFL
jgi:hypothetical protein